MSAQLQEREFTDLDEYQFSGDVETVFKKRAIVEGLRAKASVSHARHVGGIARCTYYRWYERDPQFAAACDDALEDAADNLESSVYERALNGDSLLSMFWLKAHRPKFKDKMILDIPSIRDEIKERLQTMPSNTLQFLPPAPQQQKAPTTNQSPDHTLTD